MGPKCHQASFSMDKLPSPDGKIGGTFITMPVKGLADALHECYKGFVTE
jgi:hypothetical protein